MSLRKWYTKFDEFMMKVQFTRCSYDNCVYMEKDGNKIKTYLLLYVNDMLIASVSKTEIQSLKHQLNYEFDMKDLGEAKRILGMEIERDRENFSLFLHQGSYLRKVLQRFDMHESKAVTTPLSQHFNLSSIQSP